MARSPRMKEIESLTHDEARRRNIPTAELQSFYESAAAARPVSISYPRATPLEPGVLRERNPDLDPQLVWRGKDEQDWSDLVVHAPPLYIQEKVHPKVIVEDLRRQAQQRREEADDAPDLFADFNGLPDREAKLEFYQHDQNWSNRMILGDSLQVMASLAEREGVRGQVQCIYIDPPYGIRFNSNWQVSTRSRDVKDGKPDQISREPEQIKAFRDTWKDGIHSYLTYLRDRLTIARDLLHKSGSIFVQIGDENVHRVRAIMDEILGESNFCSMILFKKTGGQSSLILPSVFDALLWYARDIGQVKFRGLFADKVPGEEGATNFDWVEEAPFSRRKLSKEEFEAKLEGRLLFYPTAGCDWSELTELFADHVDEFRFVDIAYDLRRELQPLFTEPSGFRKLQTVHEGDRAARIEQRNAETGRPYRFLKPACQIDVYERTRDTRRVTVIRRRGFGQYALAELQDNSIGIFVHRGDSPGEGGSNTHFLANRRRDHEPCSDLFNKLVRKLANRALIVSDGSNTSITFLRKFHNADVSGAKAFAELRDETFCHSPFRWRCVGHLSERYGPTLVWEVAQTGGAHTRSQTAA